MTDKVTYEFDPFELVGMDKPKGKIKQAKAEIAEFVLNAALSKITEGRSPVRNGQWKRSLSAEYKKRKPGKKFADMELTGDMLSELQCRPTSGGKILFGILGEEADKADGHNNHTGRSSLPPREFIPKADQTFKRDILQGIKGIIADLVEKE